MVDRYRLAPGLEVSRVITGLWQVADQERAGEALDPATASAAMRPYVEAGLTTFDMADHYGSAEVIVGEYDNEPPAEALTKWVPEPGAIDRATVRAAVQRALDRLQCDRLDLLQFHSWNYWDPSYLDGLQYLQELCDEGLIRHLGMTNTDAAHMRMLLHTGVPVITNQVCFSLLDQRPRQGLTQLCADEVQTLRRCRRRLGRPAKGVARGARHRRPPRRHYRQRGLSLRARTAWRSGHHHRRPTGSQRTYRGHDATLRV